MANDFHPFVGPRAFREVDRHIFCGRVAETRELVSMVIAHPLVVLFAPSGAGKSSLINAGLVPKLRDRGCEVLGPARLSGELPPGAQPPQNIYAYNVVSSFRERGGDGIPLEDLAGSLRGMKHSTDEEGESVLRVLIIDQFEELFTFAPEHSLQRALFIRQLSAALDEDSLLRVVVAINDDYFGQLDPFKALLPGELRYRLRLDLLTPQAAEEAITQPLKHSDRDIDTGALQYLCTELRKTLVRDATGATTEILGEYVEPVHLQVVCDAIWNSLNEGDKTITTQHVKKVGDVDGALRRFYEKALVETAHETRITEDELRAWVDEYLITPEGTRGLVYEGMAITGRAERGIPNSAVASLEKKFLIRAESRPGGGRWYELGHDRFIKPIQKSNRDWNETKQSKEIKLKYLWGSVIGFVIILVIAVGLGWRDLERRLEYARAEGQVDMLLELGKDDPARASWTAESLLANVAGYLWQKHDLPRLEGLLRRAEAERLIDEDFARDRWVPFVMPRRIAPTELRLTVEYSMSSRYDRGKLQYEWAVLVRSLADLWGIPAPEYVAFVENKDIPPDQVRLRTAPGSITKTIPLDPLPQGVNLVRETDDWDPKLREWFQTRKGKWIPVAMIKFGGSWWAVPAWTVPLLRAAGVTPASREGGVVLAVLNAGISDPTLLLTEENTTLLLRRLQQNYPVTIAEALVARGGIKQITRDLRAVVRDGIPLIRLNYVLDALAQAPDGINAEKAADYVNAHYASSIAPARERLTGGYAGQRPELEKVLSGPYAASLEWSPLEKAAVRVWVGKGLDDQLFDLKNMPQVEVLEGTEKVRGGLYRKLGIAPAPIDWKRYGNRRAFAIEVLNQSKDDAKPVVLNQPDKALDALREELNARYSAVAGWWLTPEDVEKRLRGLPRQSRGWLLRQYSIADITAILRRVLDEEHSSVLEFSWLLESLVFWAKAVDDPMDGKSLAHELAATQKARLEPLLPPLKIERESPIQKGIEALDQENLDMAAAYFKDAIAADRAAARQVFLASYALRAKVSLNGERDRLQGECGRDLPGTLIESKAPPDATRFEVEEYLARHRLTLRPQDRASLELCLVKAYVRTGLLHSAQVELESVSAEDPVNLDPGQLYALGFWLLEVHGFTVNPPAGLDRVQRLLANAFNRWPNASLAESAFFELIDRYRARFAVHPWYAALLETLAGQRDDSANIPYSLGCLESEFGRSAKDGESALNWVRRADSLRDLLRPGDRDLFGSQIQLCIARAYLLQAAHSDAGVRNARIDKSVATMNALIEHLEYLRKSGELQHQDQKGQYDLLGVQAFALLSDAYLLANNIGTATAVLAAGRKAFPESPDLDRSWIQLGVGASNIKDAQLLASKWAEHFPRQKGDHFRFWLATLDLLSGSENAERTARGFLASDHPYRDYVRLLLHWRLALDGSPRAKDYLTERWKDVDRRTWDARLKAGDEQVWREMLIGYSLGYVDEETILAPLRDRQTFEASPYSRMGVQGLTFDGMSCEAYFYIALFQNVTGEPSSREKRFREGLKKSIELGNAKIIEYHLARYLLSQPPRTNSSKEVGAASNKANVVHP